MTLVVDASVALKWILEEDGSERARALAARDDLLAPDLILAEVANALWRACRLRRMSAPEAKHGLQTVSKIMARLEPATRLADVAFAIALELDHPVYDCFYLALAEREAATLVTADRRLLAKVAGSGWAACAQFLGDRIEDR